MHSRLTRGLLLLLALLWGAWGRAEDSIRILVQSSPLAGSQFHGLQQLRTQMQVGDTLDLIREPHNRHDSNAIRVEWRNHKLGYVPRAENRAVAAALDAGERLSARISRLREDADPWKRLEFEILIEL